MGGHALTKCHVRRYARAEYLQLRDEASRIVQLFYELVDTPLCLDTKTDFGDLDLIVSEPKIPIDELIQQLAEQFQSKQIVINGPVISMEFREFQIDLIHSPRKNFDLMKAYLSWGDLGNLIGVMCNRLGLKYGGAGLEIRVWNSEDVTRDIGGITLSCDPRTIFSFLGLDYDRWLQGFRTEEEIYRFVTCSYCFQPRYYYKVRYNT